MEIEVRRLRVGDEEVVRALSRDDARFEEEGIVPAQRIPHALESAREFLANEANVHLVAFAGDEPVGHVLAYRLIRRHGDGEMLFICYAPAMAFYRTLGGVREASDDVVFDFTWPA